MEQDDEIKSGCLLFPPAGGNVFSKFPKKKTWQQKYCILFNASKQGIERLEIYDHKEEVMTGAIPKIITLENCIKITHSSPNTITILTKSHTQQLSTQSETETLEWVNALQSVAFKGRDSCPISCDEDNDLYCSSGEGVFSVKMCASEASTRCGFESIRYLLLLTSTAIELRDVNDNKLYATWPYRYIRRYGYRQGKFTFEAGRKCDTGEGIFHLEHPNQSEIFKCLSLKMKTMKQMIGNENLNSPEHTEFNIQPSANLFPGSRSPLVAARPDDLNLSSLSFKTTSVSSSQQSSCTERDSAPLLMPKPALKPKPQKPPRKIINVHNINKNVTKDVPSSTDESVDFGRYNKLDNYEPIDQVKRDQSPPSVPYDKVEVRSEAWKTLGIDDPDHTEFTPNLGDNPNCLKLISRSQDNLNNHGLILIPSPVVDPEDENYDRLQYFGSTSKLNKSSRYKKMEARPTTLSLGDSKNKDTWNDYDEVENVMQTARLADDSHLGYGMIRKPNTPGPQVPTAAQVQALQNQVGLEEVNHNSCNGSDYAIVSRPKRV
ncbi:fibroblast growth factor receptor substrate 2 isoform X1 [Galleria mellonella]|uniref:Fibroblast growth factor receptor substrate 2 isoform X1 n=2 Tax=Galleria mellonella TaxID=7137 RepID=A0A6J1W7J1_GALME|nr:fibroblast growth factor receptor substrate 2 isoform X1 [Galleria mellonella]